MKNLKEFIAENLENPIVKTVQENTEISENSEMNQVKTGNDETNENNENILNGQTDTAKTE